MTVLEKQQKEKNEYRIKCEQLGLYDGYNYISELRTITYAKGKNLFISNE